MAARILYDPIENPRWRELLEHHPAASIFHSSAWLKSLRQTYGYEPFVVTTSAGSALENGLVACHVKGWTSGRVVSLPFSDHCDPLMGNTAELSEGLSSLVEHARGCGATSVELRPTPAFAETFGEAGSGMLKAAGRYCFHHIDLRA